MAARSIGLLTSEMVRLQLSVLMPAVGHAVSFPDNISTCKEVRNDSAMKG